LLRSAAAAAGNYGDAGDDDDGGDDDRGDDGRGESATRRDGRRRWRSSCARLPGWSLAGSNSRAKQQSKERDDDKYLRWSHGVFPMGGGGEFLRWRRGLRWRHQYIGVFSRTALPIRIFLLKFAEGLCYTPTPNMVRVIDKLGK
jgi:hypothetical protein